MPIWSNAYLTALETDAYQQIIQDVSCLFHKFYIAPTAGRSVFTLPDKCRSILRITWRGRELEPASWNDLELLTPATAAADYSDPSHYFETSESRPRYYALHPTNIHDIRFYPTPTETFVTTGDPYAQVVDEARACVSCWRNIDQTNPIALPPPYVLRRTTKAYMLWKAFGKDGRGQNLTASSFYEKKYKFLIAQFKRINEGAFVAKKYSLDDGINSTFRFRYPKPTLPANFERTIY